MSATLFAVWGPQAECENATVATETTEKTEKAPALHHVAMRKFEEDDTPIEAEDLESVLHLKRQGAAAPDPAAPAAPAEPAAPAAGEAAPAGDAPKKPAGKGSAPQNFKSSCSLIAVLSVIVVFSSIL